MASSNQSNADLARGAFGVEDAPGVRTEDDDIDMDVPGLVANGDRAVDS